MRVVYPERMVNVVDCVSLYDREKKSCLNYKSVGHIGLTQHSDIPVKTAHQQT